MKRTICNPLDLEYRYQHMNENGNKYAFREGADPTLVYFKGEYLLFVSMSAGFWHSKDMCNWQFKADSSLLIYDYAPDVRQIGDYLYFCASKREENCPILRTKDPFTEPFEEVSAPFPFWDPDLFCDDDGRVYLYWGCTNTQPIYGIELDAKMLTPIGEKQQLIFADEAKLGFERPGDNGVVNKENSVVYQHLKHSFNEKTQKIEFPAGVKELGGFTAEAMTQMFLSIGKPYIEGAFMTKHGGKYYLQYACPGTQYNTYCDGVYVGDSPLGKFTLQHSNPFSSKPGGFATGAGHGSTIKDEYGNYWHAATMRISKNHDFERRIGLFPAGFDADGILYCNQNFADYPLEIPHGKFNALEIQPKYMLLSYNKQVTASSTAEGSSAAFAADEDIRTWWSAASENAGEWLCVDLGESYKEYTVHAVQVNLADENISLEFPPESYGDARKTRRIELDPQISNYVIEISENGENWLMLENVSRECSNGYYEYESGVKARYVRVTGGKLPYNQALRISGLRIFGKGEGAKPAKASAKAVRNNSQSALDAKVTWQHIENAQGCNVRYGTAPNKLYQSWLVYGADEVTLSTLIAGQSYYICVDSFNENGITNGDVFKLTEEA